MKFLFRQWNRKLQRGVSYLVAFVMVCALFCVGTPTAHASGTVLKIGYSDANGIFEDENGKPYGYAVEYMEAFAKHTGWEFEWVPYSWEKCLLALEQGEVDLMVMTRYTEGRRERFLYSSLSMGYNHAVLFTDPHSDIYYQDHHAFEGKRIGVAGGTVVESSIIRHNSDLDLDCKVVPFLSESVAR